MICPESRPIQQLLAYIFNLARYDDDWDVRDRARFLKGLLRSILQNKENTSNDQGEDEQADSGGVVLRREQIKMVLLAAKEIPAEIHSGAAQFFVFPRSLPPLTYPRQCLTIEERRQGDLVLGTLSSLAARRLADYEPLADWTDDPTDPSLRDVEVSSVPRMRLPILIFDFSNLQEEKPVRPCIDSRTASAIQTPLAVASPPFAQSGGGSPVSAGIQQRLPPVQAKNRFQNLDDFLNESDSEDESEESDDPSPHAAEAESADESSESETATDEESAHEGDGLVPQGR